jgi:RNA polymerase sigma-70 factor (ECF subfamily)
MKGDSGEEDEDAGALFERARSARAAWPDVAFSDEEFAAVLAAHVDVKAAYDADFYLASACAANAPGAVAAFDRVFLAQVPRFISRMRLSADSVDELCQSLREKLFVGATPKILSYEGNGPLGGWLRIAAVRAAIDLTRGRTGGLDVSTDDLTAPFRSDAELHYLSAEGRALVHKAFQHAAAALTSAERNVLRFHLVDGLSFDELARLLHTSRSSAFRMLTAAREKILDAARSYLCDTEAMSTTDFESLMNAVRSGLDLSLSAILRAG